MPDFLKVIVFSASAFVFMFLIAKMLGKKTNCRVRFYRLRSWYHYWFDSGRMGNRT